MPLCQYASMSPCHHEQPFPNSCSSSQDDAQAEHKLTLDFFEKDFDFPHVTRLRIVCMQAQRPQCVATRCAAVPLHECRPAFHLRCSYFPLQPSPTWASFTLKNVRCYTVQQAQPARWFLQFLPSGLGTCTFWQLDPRHLRCMRLPSSRLFPLGGIGCLLAPCP